MKIKFDIARPEYSWADKPVPALSSLPEWYKDMKAFENKENKFSEPFYPTEDKNADFDFMHKYFEGIKGKVAHRS